MLTSAVLGLDAQSERNNVSVRLISGNVRGYDEDG